MTREDVALSSCKLTIVCVNYSKQSVCNDSHNLPSAVAVVVVITSHPLARLLSPFSEKVNFIASFSLFIVISCCLLKVHSIVRWKICSYFNGLKMCVICVFWDDVKCCKLNCLNNQVTSDTLYTFEYQFFTIQLARHFKKKKMNNCLQSRQVKTPWKDCEWEEKANIKRNYFHGWKLKIEIVNEQ